jgi:hypothetical protein
MTAQKTLMQNAYETTLALAIGADATEVAIQVNAAPNGTPSASVPMYLVIDPDSDATREYVKVTSRSGVSLTVVRNIDTVSGGLNAHAVGAKVRMVAMKQHFDDLNDRVDTIMNSDGTAVNTSGLVKDEDTMSSDSDTHLATQQSIKAYVDNQVTAQDLDFTADTTTGTPSIDLDSETLNVAGGAGIETSASGNEITVAIDSTVVTESSTDTLTNKSIDLTNNTLTGTLAEFQTAVSDATLVDLDDAQTLTNKIIDSATNTLTVDADEATVQNIEVDNLKSGVLDTDLSSVSASDDTIPSAKATKAYVDAQVDTKDTLAELDDVTITTVADNDVIAYDTTSGDYINQSASEAGLATSSDLTSHTGDTSNPHSVTAAQTGATTTSNKITDFTAPTSDLDMNSNKITNVTDPTAAQDAATKSYVDAQVDTADTLAELNDVTITTPTEDEVLAYDSGTSEFINQTPSEAGLATSAQGALADSAVQPASTDTLTNKTIDADGTGNNITNIDNANIKAAAAIDATKIADGSVTSAKFQYIGGLTSDAQTQINSKLANINSESIDELSDVDTSTVSPTEGQALLWDSTDNEWQPGDVASSSAAKIIDADGDTQIQTEESVDEDKLRFDTAGTERAVMDTTLALTTNGGLFQHNQTQAGIFTIASDEGTVVAGPITITGTVTNAGTMVIL